MRLVDMFLFCFVFLLFEKGEFLCIIVMIVQLKNSEILYESFLKSLLLHFCYNIKTVDIAI